ncbi:MAG: 50S ribosomal protein L11 methyltransferase [Actinomycetota bacterium]
MREPDHHSVEVEVAEGDVDVVLDRLWQCHPLAVGEAQTGAGEVRYTAGFADAPTARAAMETLAAWQPRLQAVGRDDWVATWRRGATPNLAGTFRVRLPEHTESSDHLDVVIEPGSSFGFGHASTLTALELLSTIDLAGASVADVGCGSGVLAIAACLRGASRVHAVDIAEEAVTTTVDNASRNGATVEVAQGSVEALPPGPFDVVVANLTAGTQQLVLPQLGERVGRETTIVLSGLLIGQEAAVESLLHGQRIVDRRTRDGWIAVRLESTVTASPRP